MPRTKKRLTALGGDPFGDMAGSEQAPPPEQDALSPAENPAPAESTSKPVASPWDNVIGQEPRAAQETADTPGLIPGRWDEASAPIDNRDASAPEEGFFYQKTGTETESAGDTEMSLPMAPAEETAPAIEDTEEMSLLSEIGLSETGEDAPSTIEDTGEMSLLAEMGLLDSTPDEGLDTFLPESPPTVSAWETAPPQAELESVRAEPQGWQPEADFAFEPDAAPVGGQTEPTEMQPQAAAEAVDGEPAWLAEAVAPFIEEQKAEVAPTTTAPATPLQAEPPQDTSGPVLDDLIARVDDEVEAAFGPSVSAEAAPERRERVRGNVQEQHILFMLAGSEYGVPLLNVTEVSRPLPITPVPNTPDWVMGVANLRGDIVSVVDLRRFLGIGESDHPPTTRILVSQARPEEITVGLVVDRVRGVRFLTADEIKPPAGPIADRVAGYLRGVCEHDGRTLAILDFDKLLLSPEMRQFQ